MTDLIQVKNNFAMCDSLRVAEKFHKNHRDVTRDIDNLIAQNCAVNAMFSGSEYKAKNGQLYRMYYMNRDGFSLLAMGFTGKEALHWKLEYIKAFNAMEAYIQERQSPHWHQTRLESKSNRRMETDEIKQLVEYAKEQGSKNADRYYCNLSKLANKAVGIQTGSRDEATVNQLNNIVLIERIIANVVREGMQQGFYYKDIYKACKARIEAFREVAYLGVA